MRYRVQLLCLLLSVVIIAACSSSSDKSDSSSKDQDDGPPASEWRYAFNPESQELMAYSLDGDMNIIADDLPERVPPYLNVSLGDYGGLVGYIDRVNDKTIIYHVTPRRADVLDLDSDLRWYPVTQTERYVVLHGAHDSDEFGPIVLFDAKTGQLHDLQGGTRWSDQQWCCGFSADGSTLRYLSLATSDASAWSIIERNLETGEERDFFAPGLDFSDEFFEILARTDVHGERWFWRIQGTNLVQPDGTNEVLNAESEPPIGYSFVDDYLVESPACESDCVITVIPLEGDSVSLQIGELFIDDLRRIDETQFLTTDRDANFWLLGVNVPPQLIGVGDSSTSTINSQSPDGRWLTLTDNRDEPTKVFIWDTTRQEAVFEIAADAGENIGVSRVYYSPNGEIITLTGQSDQNVVVFNYETGESSTLPDVENESRRYFELLPDGSVLLNRRENETRTELGIWIYDPADDTMSQVMPEGRWQPFNIQILQ